MCASFPIENEPSVVLRIAKSKALCVSDKMRLAAIQISSLDRAIRTVGSSLAAEETNEPLILPPLDKTSRARG